MPHLLVTLVVEDAAEGQVAPLRNLAVSSLDRSTGTEDQDQAG